MNIVMLDYLNTSRESLETEYKKVRSDYESLKMQGFNLNIARGKPSKSQLDLVSDI